MSVRGLRKVCMYERSRFEHVNICELHNSSNEIKGLINFVLDKFESPFWCVCMELFSPFGHLVHIGDIAGSRFWNSSRLPATSSFVKKFILVPWNPPKNI